MNKVKINKATKLLATFFATEGKIHSEQEYIQLGNLQPVAGSSIRYIFGGYRGAMIGLKQSQYWPSIKHLDKPQVETVVKATETKAPVEPIPAKKPVDAKPAKVKVEKQDG